MATPNVQIPSKLLLDKTIPAEYKLFYGLIYYFCGSNGYIWHKNKTLAKEIGKSERSVRRAIKALVDANYLVVKKSVKANSIYQDNYERVIWLYDNYHGMRARAKTKKKQTTTKKKKPLTLTIFKRLVKKYYPTNTPIFAFKDWKLQDEFQIGYSKPLVLDSGGYLALEDEPRSLFADDATKCWYALFSLYNRDTSLFPVLADAKRQKEQKE